MSKYEDAKKEFGDLAGQYWYEIMHALNHRDRQLQKQIDEAKKTMVSDDGTVIYKSLEYLIEECERLQMENKRVMDALTPAFKKCRA